MLKRILHGEIMRVHRDDFGRTEYFMVRVDRSDHRRTPRALKIRRFTTLREPRRGDQVTVLEKVYATGRKYLRKERIITCITEEEKTMSEYPKTYSGKITSVFNSSGGTECFNVRFTTINGRDVGDMVTASGYSSALQRPRIGDCVTVVVDVKDGIHTSTITRFNNQEEQTMAMSKDRVRFFIRENYYGNKLQKIFQQAFDMPYDETASLMRSERWRCGFWIVCRPSQFARFMIFRNEVGLQNGFKDLKPELISDIGDVYTQIADCTKVDRCDVKRVLTALNYSIGAIEQQIRQQSDRSLRSTYQLDVSDRAHQPCYSK